MTEIRTQMSEIRKTGRAAIIKKIVLFGLCSLLLPLCSEVDAQPPNKVYRIGFLSGGDPGSSPETEALREGLRELGYVEGKNLGSQRTGKRASQSAAARYSLR